MFTYMQGPVDITGQSYQRVLVFVGQTLYSLPKFDFKKEIKEITQTNKIRPNQQKDPKQKKANTTPPSAKKPTQTEA